MQISIPVSQEQQETTREINGYHCIRILGSGTSGVVWEAKKDGDPSSKSVALKLCTNYRFGIPQEVEVGRNLNHAHCLPVMDHFPYEEPSQMNMRSYAIVMPLCHGDLDVTAGKGSMDLLLSPVPGLTVSETLRVLLQIGSALEYMHSQNIVHRDLKPANVMVKDGEYLLADYGQALKLSREDDKLLDMNAGTRLFWAPEIDSRVPYLPKPADIWALAVSAWHFVFGTYPYTIANVLAKDTTRMYNYVREETQCDLTFPSLPPVPDDLKRIFAGMLEKDPLQRMTATQLATDPWLNETVRRWEEVVNAVLDS